MRNASVLVPDDVAGRESVTLTFGLIAVTVALYLSVPDPSVVNGSAAPPAVAATWKVFAVDPTTK